MATFPLKIMTPDGVAFDGAVTSVSCRTINGQLQLLARHIDICTALGMGEAHIKLEDGTVSKARAEALLAQKNLDKRDMQLAEARLRRALVRSSVAARKDI